MFSMPDEDVIFRENDVITAFSDIDSALSPPGYSFDNLDGYATYYKVEVSCGVPEITEIIKVDPDLHVQLFHKGSPVPLPHWFTKGSDCKLKYKSAFENMPVHIQNYVSKKDGVDTDDLS